MGEVLFDFGLLATVIVGVTAMMGVISNVIGTKVFGRGNASQHLDQSLKTQAGWKSVGGKK